MGKFLGLIGILLLAGCDYQSRQSTFDPKGPVALRQLELFNLTVWVCTFIFIFVGGALAYAVWKYRERKSDDPDFKPKQSHGNPLVEIGLIVASILLLVVIAIPTLDAIWYTHDTPDDEASKLGAWYQGELSEGAETEVLEVVVYGLQWWWEFQYPQLGITTANELIIPVGKVVHVELRSRDVLHSFWLPKIAGKVDTIPGRANSMWIQADEEGHYYGQCAEYCGESHAYMLFRADALSNEDFHKWVEHQKTPPKAPDGGDDWGAWISSVNANPDSVKGDDVLEGASLFYSKTCVVCHAIQGAGIAGIGGPDLTHVASRKTLAAGWLDNRKETNDESGDAEIDPEIQLENLTRWIYESENIKPGNRMYIGSVGVQNGLNTLKGTPNEITEEEARKIAIFLQNLK